MTKSAPANHRLAPAARSGLDVALWFLIRASEERQQLSMPKLQLLLYFAQATYAGARDGRQLMPGIFLAGEDGPYEPNVAVALECGLANPPEPTMAADVEPLLRALWRQYGALPTAALHRVAANDGVWHATLERGVNAEIEFTAMRKAYGIKPPAEEATTRQKRDIAAKAASKPERLETDLRFTGDGRLVTRWAPRRRIEREDS
jgi:uncharacterized phage-associated protein